MFHKSIFLKVKTTCKQFQKMARAGTDYLVENDLEDLYELLERGLLEDNIDFGRKLDSVMDKGEIEENCKEYVFSRGVKRRK